MATQYNIDSQTKGVNGFGLPFCKLVYTSALAANTDTSLVVPTSAAVGAPAATTYNKFIAVFSYQPSSKVWVALNAAAAAPAGAPFALSTSELNPLAKYVKAGDTVHMLCVAGADVSVAFYAIQD